MSKPSVHEMELGANGSGANRSYHGNAPGRPCNRALACIQRRRSGSAAATADCIESNVARVTLLANREASRGLSQPRRRLTMLASPFTAFIAAAHATATVGQALISAAYAASRTAGSACVPNPRIAAIGIVSAPSASSTIAVSCDVTSACIRSHAAEPVMLSSA